MYGIQCDVSEAEDIRELGHLARQQLGTVHLWINNAGSVTRKKMLADVDSADISAAVGEDWAVLLTFAEYVWHLL